MKIKELIEKLEQKSNHQFLKAVSKPEFAFPLPQDLKFFYENYEYAILAKSFTELLEKLVSNEKEWFWLDSSFQSYGDAYEDE